MWFWRDRPACNSLADNCTHTHTMEAKIKSILEKYVVGGGFVSTILLVPKKDSGQRPKSKILDGKGRPEKMLTLCSQYERTDFSSFKNWLKCLLFGLGYAPRSSAGS